MGVKTGPRRALASVALLLVLGGVPAAETQAPAADAAGGAFAAWLEALRADALAAGIRAETVDRALAGIEPLPIVIERDRTQAEFTQTLRQYVDRRVSARVIRRAREEVRRHRRLLARVQAAHGVPSEILVAVWALESNFGRFSGVRPTVAVLATLAFDGRRGALFRSELLDALRILDRGDIELARMKGSWAGAMGQPQFLPSSYLRYAQDFDEDGRRDIWTSLPDVFASIGNYLQTNGWTKGYVWGRRVRLPAKAGARLDEAAALRTEGCRAMRQLTQPLPLARWRALGVRTAAGGALPRADLDASLLRVDGNAYLVYGNYEALLRYNCAHTYALSVALLGDRIEGRSGSWPLR